MVRRPALLVATLAITAAVVGTAFAGSGPTANSSASAEKTAEKALKKAKKAQKLAKNHNHAVNILYVDGAPKAINPFGVGSSFAFCPGGTRATGGSSSGTGGGGTAVTHATALGPAGYGAVRIEEFGNFGSVTSRAACVETATSKTRARVADERKALVAELERLEEAVKKQLTTR